MQPSYLYLGLVYILVEVVKVVNTAYIKTFKVKVGINFRYDICFVFLSKFFIFNISFHTWAQCSSLSEHVHTFFLHFELAILLLYFLNTAFLQQTFEFFQRLVSFVSDKYRKD